MKQPETLEDKSVSSFLKMANLRRLLAYLKPHKVRMTIAICSLLIGTGFGLLFPRLVVKLLEGVSKTRDYHLLNVTAGVLVGVFLLQGVFNYLKSYLMAFIGERIVFRVRTQLYEHIQGLSLDFFAKKRVGDLISRLSSDVSQIDSLLTNGIGTLLTEVTMLIGAFVLMLNMNARITLFILILAPLLILVAVHFSSKIEKASTQVQDHLAKSTVVAEEGLQSVHIVKSFGRERYETSRFYKAMEDTFHSSLRVLRHTTLFTAFMNFLGFCAIAAVIWFGGREVIAGRLSLAQITGFLIYGITIATCLGSLAGLFGQLSAATGGIQRVFELLDTPPTVQDAPGAVALSTCNGKITFNDVFFSYDGVTPVIQGVSLDIQPGEVLALVGLSGAGKTTVFNLLPRFYDPTGGSIQIDGHDLKDLTQESLRSHMALVPQETMLFGGTIRENLMYGRLDATETEMIAASKDAHAHEFIMSLPQQYESVVGERGGNLSGGQRQRIAIARAILKNPRILLLDEATSALDNESEELVQDALNRLMQNDRTTTIIIAHRLSTIKVANRIAVMDGGRIAELGTHQELMDLNGIYARLYMMQFRKAEETHSTGSADAELGAENARAVHQKPLDLADILV